MRGCFGFFMFIIVTIWLLFGFLVFTAVRSWAFDRQFYTDIVDNDALYESFRTEGLPEFLAELEVNGQQVLNRNDPAFPALVEATSAILPTDYLRTTAVSVVDELFTFFENPSSGLTLNIDLTPIKDSLRGAQGTAFAQTYIRNLSQCPSATSFTTDNLPTCIPQGVSQAEAIAYVEDYKDRFVNTIPDTWDLTEEDMDFSGLPSVSLIESVNGAYAVFGGITFLFWFVNAIVGGRGFKGLLMWLGGMLFLPALIILLTGAAFGGSVLDSVANSVIRDTATSNLAMSGQMQDSFVLVVLDALRRVSNGFLSTGAIALGVSLVLYILGGIMRRPNQTVNVGYYSDPSYPIKPL